MNTFVGHIDGRLFGLIERWVSWVTVNGVPSSSAALPEFGALGCRIQRSRSQRVPSDILGFGACVSALSDLDQLVIGAFLFHSKDRFPSGREWTKRLTELFHSEDREPKPQEIETYGIIYKGLLRKALRRLETRAREHGWLNSDERDQNPAIGDHNRMASDC